MKTIPQPGAATLLVVVGTTCLLLFVFQKMLWLVLPVLLALILYYCLRPVVVAVVACGVPRETAAAAVCLLQMIVAAGVLILTLLLVAKAGTWQESFVRYLAGGQDLLRKTTGSLEKVVPMFKKMNLGAQVDQHVQQFTAGFVEKNLLPLTLELLKWLPSLLLVPYITYFMLVESGRFKKYIIKSVPNAFFEKALLLFSHLDASLQSYFQGLLALTVLDAACLGLGLGLLGIANATLLGFIAAMLSWVPYLGSVAGCVMVVLVAATDYPEMAWKAYACLALFVGVRLLDDFVLLPLTIGRNLQVHPLLSVLMLFLGASVAGPTGLLLALPLFGVVAVIGETVAQVVIDRRLRARYRAARRLAASWEQI